MGMETAALAIATVVAAAGTAYSAYSASETASYNAKVAEASAKAAQDKAAYDEALHRERVRKLLSSQQAAYGASGVQGSSGSPLLTELDTTRQGELDALAIRYGGAIESAQAMNRAAGYRSEGQSALTGGMISAGSSLLQEGYKTYKAYKGT